MTKISKCSVAKDLLANTTKVNEHLNSTTFVCALVHTHVASNIQS